jgi:hypothetical protein
MHHRPRKIRPSKLNTIQEIPNEQDPAVMDARLDMTAARPPVIDLDDMIKTVPLRLAAMPPAHRTSPWLIVLGSFLSNSASFGMTELNEEPKGHFSFDPN